MEKFINQLEKKFDLISIDPPYNTGKKMGKYRDNYGNIEDWLIYLEPFLMYSKKFLSDRGIIFININDKNSPYLRILCDKVFGMENYVSTIVWQNKYSVSNDMMGISCQTENILVYAKNIKKIQLNYDLLSEGYVSKTYKNYDNDPRGAWRKGMQLWKHKNKKSYTVTSPNGKEWTKNWNYSEEEWYNTLVKNDLLYWGDDGNSCPTKKVFLKNTKGIGIKNIWLGCDVGYTSDGTSDLKKCLGIEAAFLYPKPVKLIKRILQICTTKNSKVLDFFAGSGTLGQAVYEYNIENGTQLEFMLCTNNENNLCDDITYKRLSKFANNINGGLTYATIPRESTFFELFQKLMDNPASISMEETSKMVNTFNKLLKIEAQEGKAA
ncbi:MAG: site-specific DNA-methyltransferase [Bacteroidota bacterium]|nr:site-specific DNA-methyltransferase [Bacteroidota bacterium]